MTSADATIPEHHLVTGFPTNPLAVNLVASLVERHRSTERENAPTVTCLVSRQWVKRARERLAGLAGGTGVKTVQAELHKIDFGLPGVVYRKLLRDVSRVHHCGAALSPASGPELAREAYVESAREVSEFCVHAKQLRHVVHWSSLLVAPLRATRLEEELLPKGTRHRSELEAAQARAERILRGAGLHIPVTTLRLAPLLGNSYTGFAERFDGPYLVVLWTLNARRQETFFPPTDPQLPMQVLPVDLALAQGLALVKQQPNGVFHVGDRQPVSVQHACELVAQAASLTLPRPKPRSLASRAELALQKHPLYRRAVGRPKLVVESLPAAREVSFAKADALLPKSAREVVALRNYVKTVVDFLMHEGAQRLSGRPPQAGRAAASHNTTFPREEALT